MKVGVLKSVWAIALTLLALSPLVVGADYLATITLRSPYFYDMNGDRLRILEKGNQVLLTTTFFNNSEEKIDFVGLFDVRDMNGIDTLVAWQSSTIEPFGNKTIGVSWVVPESSAYQSRAFAVTNFTQPQVLSVVESSETEMPEP